MKIHLIIISIMFVNLYSCSAQTFYKISKNISDCQLKEGIRKEDKEDYYHDIRIKLNDLGQLKFVEKSDTLFLLESYNIENGSFYGKIWNTHSNKVEYIYNQGKFDFNPDKIFTNYMCFLISKWNINSIREEEKKNSTMTNPLLIFGSRIIKKGSDYNIDCIMFNEFFNLERDK
jgi:hypothetical protein